VGVAHSESDDGNNVRHKLWATMMGRGKVASRSEAAARSEVASRSEVAARSRNTTSKMGTVAWITVEDGVRWGEVSILQLTLCSLRGAGGDGSRWRWRGGIMCRRLCCRRYCVMLRLGGHEALLIN
jgi:hypothetical protein